MKWSKFDEEKVRTAGITNYFMINADGVTGGGIFRRMYGDFLIQASNISSCEVMKQLGLEYIDVSRKWDMVGCLMWKLSETAEKQLLHEISDIVKEIHTEETSLLTKLQPIVNQ